MTAGEIQVICNEWYAALDFWFERTFKQRQFHIDIGEQTGIGIRSSGPFTAKCIGDNLLGCLEYLSEEQIEIRRRLDYNSIFAEGDRVCILYGPLSLCNHASIQGVIKKVKIVYIDNYGFVLL